uniref:ECRG4 augurin precursor a n=1 Tax=Oryzias latipes TaxID=8090 RepID=A0A3P9KMP2_ORYLA
MNLFCFFSCLSAAFVLHVFMEKYLVKKIPLRAENAPSCGSAAVGREVNGIPVPQASFHLESLGFSPLISLVAEQLLHSCCFSGALEKLKSGSNMASQQLGVRVTFLVVVAMLTLLTVAETGKSPSESTIAVPSSKAKEFLLKLSRSKRNIWDRSRPDVQQWIMQFMQLGYDEQRLEADLSYWMDQARASDHGRQHHYDENSPYGP